MTTMDVHQAKEMNNQALHDQYTLHLDDPLASLAAVGGKGASLARLSRAGLPVPEGFYVTTGAYDRFVAENDLWPGIAAALDQADPARPTSLEAASLAIRELFAGAHVPDAVAQAIAGAYVALPGDSPIVAVRSSATAEDLPDLSFAGQQDTYLNIEGLAAVQDAVRRCWASLWTARAIGYRMQHGIDQETVSLAVVVQVLVDAEAAGILFTANPVDGQRGHAMISAAWGLGEAVVGGAVTPDTLVVDKATAGVVSRQTADKQVMTVRVEGGTEEQAVPDHLRHAPVLDDQTAAELARLGVQIEQLYGQPMDIEWALAGGKFAILQARPITAMPEPPGPAIDWTLSNPKDKFMRVSICELMPDPLSPLFATLGFEHIDRGINDILVALFKMPSGTLSGFMQTVNGYGYQNANFTAGQWATMLWCMVPRFPMMLREGVGYWQTVAHPRYEAAVQAWGARPLRGMTIRELHRGMLEVLDAFSFHLGSLMTSTMGPSAGSEGIFTKVYEKVAKRPEDPPAPAFLMGFDSAPIRADKALYDLALWCRERPDLAAYLASTSGSELAEQFSLDSSPAGVPPADWVEWTQRFHAHLERHGYSIYDMDFMKPLPMDEPGPILEILKLFIAGKGTNPYERQQAYAERREQAVESTRPRLKGLKRWAFEKSLKWAQSQAPLREDGIAEIGMGYPVLRRLLHEMGRRFVEAGMIEQPEDIYWLEGAELEDAVDALEQGKPLGDSRDRVQDRKDLWRARKQVTPPPMLPPKAKYLGMDTDGIIAIRSEDTQGDVIHGVAASPGRASGVAKVLHGPEDFGQMQPGDILVASITTPAWTPLFVMASAVVTDIGGPLSHGSIVAREYGIPAVLGTGVATRRIRSGQRITVDGSAGQVTLVDGEHPTD